MKKFFPIIILVALVGCEKIVDIKDPVPKHVRFCEVDESLVGHWQSDSVWVETHVDSLDTTYLNTRPTYYYDLLIECGADTSFILKYVNYSGVVTNQVNSSNYGSTDTSFVAFDAFDTNKQPPNASFEMPFEITSDTSLAAYFSQTLNSDQRTVTRLWLSKVK